MKSETSACNVDFRPYSVEDAKKLLNGRKIFIWGAGQKGRGFKLALERNGFKVEAFLDKSPLLRGTKYQGTDILDPQTVLREKDSGKTSFIFIASVDKKNKEMFKECQQAGLEKLKDYINIQVFCPFYPTVEVSGICNLKCISCPRCNETLSRSLPKGFMSAATYKEVIDKLVSEIPFLYLVDLYLWGEPLLNPDLAEIIRINNRLGLASGISSNLNVSKHLEEVIKESPAQIRISISGYGPKNYEETHTGGKWERLHKNLLLLAEYIKKYKTNTIVEIYYHVNKNNVNEYQKLLDLCTPLGFRVAPSIHMVLHDHALDYVEKKTLPDGVKKAIDLMHISLDEMLATAKSEHHKSCLLKRCVPVINWDLKVFACCNYVQDAVLAPNYLDITLDKIIELRNNCTLCRKCQGHSLHRYFNPLYYYDFTSGLCKPAI